MGSSFLSLRHKVVILSHVSSSKIRCVMICFLVCLGIYTTHRICVVKRMNESSRAESYLRFPNEMKNIKTANYSLLFFFFSYCCSPNHYKSVVDTDGNPPDMAEDPPFNTALAGSVGIFGYTITEGWYNETANSYGATTGGQCATYEDMFFGQTGYPSLATSQFCVLVAPILAGIGLFANLVDFCVCNFSGSNLIGSLFFISASLVSAGTFLLLADPAFW